MRHVDAADQLAGLALEPVRLARLEDDPSPEAVELRAHVAACDRCAAELAAIQRASTEIRAGVPARGDVEPPIRPPAVLRERALARASAERPMPPAPIPRRAPPDGRSRRLPWLVAAVALIVALGTGALSIAQVGRVDALRSENQELRDVTSTLDRILADPDHWTVVLRTADGAPGGTLSWTAEHLTVVTTGLPVPGPGQRYRCWAEQDGARTPLGWMSFSGSVGYWAGSFSRYGASLSPGGRFGVSLVPDEGDGTPVLIAGL
jgi:hypothetical protein